MATYFKGAFVGLTAAIAVAVVAWALGVGPRVTQRIYPPPPSSPSPGSDQSVVFGPTTETDYVFPRSEQAVALLVLVGGAAWSVRRDRRRSSVA